METMQERLAAWLVKRNINFNHYYNSQKKNEGYVFNFFVGIYPVCLRVDNIGNLTLLNDGYVLAYQMDLNELDRFFDRLVKNEF